MLDCAEIANVAPYCVAEGMVSEDSECQTIAVVNLVVHYTVHRQLVRLIAAGPK